VSLIAEHLPAIYDVFAEAITIASADTRGIPSDGYANPGGLGVSALQPSIRVIASENPAVAAGQSLVWAGTTYRIYDVQAVSPDKGEYRLLLERQ